MVILSCFRGRNVFAMSLHSLWERANLWFCGGLFCFYLYVCLKECHLDDVIVGSSWLFHNGLGDYTLKMCFIWRCGSSEMWVLNRQGWLHYGKCKEPVDFGATGLSSCIISAKSGPTWVNRTLSLVNASDVFVLCSLGLTISSQRNNWSKASLFL